MTSDHARHALSALAVYCERGEAALRCLEADDPDGAADALQRRAAAFHNFRAQDELARKSGADIATDPDAKALLARIKTQDSELIPRLESARERALEQATKVREARAKLARFRSSGGGPDRGNGFSRGA